MMDVYVKLVVKCETAANPLHMMMFNPPYQ